VQRRNDKRKYIVLDIRYYISYAIKMNRGVAFKVVLLGEGSVGKVRDLKFFFNL
jgi:hypothetical protein